MATYDGSHCLSAVYQVVTDALGSVRRVLDATNTVVAQFDYDSWGNLLSSSFDSVPGGGLAYRFVGAAGVRWDAATGLYYMRARWYDSRLARFLVRDPYRSGPNLYHYTHNNPTLRIDPLGTDDGWAWIYWTPFGGLATLGRMLGTQYYSIENGFHPQNIRPDNDIRWGQGIDDTSYDTIVPVVMFVIPPALGALRTASVSVRGLLGSPGETFEKPLSETTEGPCPGDVRSKTIGIGLKRTYPRLRRMGAITWHTWYDVGLSRVPYWRLLDNFWFRQTFIQAAKNADWILFDPTGFVPGLIPTGITQWELDRILNDPELWMKTTFLPPE